LIEEVDGFGAVGLQRLDDLLARQERLRLLAKLVDLFYLLVELCDLVLQELVAALLGLDLGDEDHMDQPDSGKSQDRESDRNRDELALARLALLLAVGQ
jgi:hypothetical protein